MRFLFAVKTNKEYETESKHTRSQFRGYKDCSRNIHLRVHANPLVSFLSFVMSSFVWEEHVTPRVPLWRWNT